MNSFKTAIAIAIGSLFAGAAFAQSNFEIEQRDRAEQARIDRGVQSGQLTSREADRLQGERAQIERLERRARADGVLTRNERARIDGAQDRLSRNIYRETHDRQTAGNASGHPHGWDRGNGNDWGRGNDHRNGNGWGRGNDHGNGNGHQQSDRRDGNHGQRNESHSNGVTPRTGGEAHAGRSDRGAGRQASMPQAQARATQTNATRPITVARSGDSGRRTR